MSSAPMLPFSGVKVISFAQMGQGPAAVQLLADYGADVIKVERPGTGAYERSWSGADAFRDGESYFFHSLNRNQRSLTLDLKSADGMEIVTQLIESADVLVENYRPGVMERLGLGYDELAVTNPRLIYCSSSGYGPVGPFRDAPGQDLLLQAFSGLARSTGRRSDPPIPTGSPVVDFHAGVLLAFGIASALYARAASGRGQRVETSLLEAAMHLQWEPLFYQLNGWDVTGRTEEGLASTFHQGPYGVYQTADGYVTISLMPLGALAQALGIPQLKDIPEDQKYEQRDTIKRLVEERTRLLTSDEVLSLLREKDLWAAPVLDVQEFLEHPQVLANRLYSQWPREDGSPIVHMRTPLRLSGAPEEKLPHNNAPALGAHSTEILTELGIGPERIAQLRAAGTI